MILKFNVKDTTSVPREKEDGQTRKMKRWLENKVSVYFKTVKMLFLAGALLASALYPIGKKHDR